MRSDGRHLQQLRPIRFSPNPVDYAEGSVLVEFGKTRLICTATYEEQGPKWLQGTGRGWVTAEYGMLPRSTHTRMKRDKISEGGRTQEISRLVGRSLRACLNLSDLTEKQIIVDCDVINADGGTRTAAVSGGFVALALAIKKLRGVGEIKSQPLHSYVAGVSVGFEKEQFFLDLNYDEDSKIGADVNFVMNNLVQFVEVQGTAEHQLFRSQDMQKMMELARSGCESIFKLQESLVGDILPLEMKS